MMAQMKSKFPAGPGGKGKPADKSTLRKSTAVQFEDARSTEYEPLVARHLRVDASSARPRKGAT